VTALPEVWSTAPTRPTPCGYTWFIAVQLAKVCWTGAGGAAEMTRAGGFGATVVILTGLLVCATETGAGGGAEIVVTADAGGGTADDEVVNAAAADVVARVTFTSGAAWDAALDRPGVTVAEASFAFGDPVAAPITPKTTRSAKIEPPAIAILRLYQGGETDVGA
jgi:hypothetical protein